MPSSTCHLCDAGFPLSRGKHIGTQALGTIPTTRCRRVPVHLAVDRPGPFGGTVYTSLCGRLRAGNDANRAIEAEEVTCKFCIRKRDRIAAKRALRTQAPSHGA